MNSETVVYGKSNQEIKLNNETCLSKMKSYIKIHPYKFIGIISGIVVATVTVIVPCAVLINKDSKREEEIRENSIFPLEEKLVSEEIQISNSLKKEEKEDNSINLPVENLKSEIIEIYNSFEKEEGEKEERGEEKEIEEKEEEIEDIPIYPLEERLKSEVLDIYNAIGERDKGTLSQFHEYLSEKASNLKEEQKVYLAFYWVTRNIEYDHEGLKAGTVVYLPEQTFQKRTTVCSGYSWLFKDLLLAMNYPESKILNIVGYSKGSGYSPFKEPESDHEWNAVEINGKWCLIDTTWAVGGSEYYLCTNPKCFVRDHLPFKNDSLQFLENPITLKRFHELINTDINFCEKNVEIIEDKQIQNICGKGKVIVKNKENNSKKFFLEVIPFVPDGSLSQFLTPINDGYEINFSVNDAGEFECLVLYNGSFLATINFNCSEEPLEEFFYPELQSLFITSNAQLISPLNGHLIIGQRYNFEIKIDNLDNLTIESGRDSISMTKNGKVFKEEDVYIHNDTINIYSGRNKLVSFVGIGERVDYPICYTI